MLKYILLLIFFSLASCGKECAPKFPHQIKVCFKGGWKIKKWYGIGGGALIKNDSTSEIVVSYPPMQCDTSFVLELAVSKDTTRYVFEHEDGQDIIALSHQYVPSYTAKCGLSLRMTTLNLAFPATTFSPTKAKLERGVVSITK